ncbi:MAG: trigger factor [Candidatus Nanopelagicales bacterium]|nr:trigger factor [Candidatus Nanopelagicales bacterium]MDP4714914.1 trigger factor [Candidatus Nanopelagicales bacterium]MDP4906989.1 trigger factor [Candidatus Nanopelagicales bacterium]MDP4975061.1 trigger factor [Candidatus Nanopelagicales bacterium]
MKSTAETLSPTRVKLTVEVPFEELAPSLDTAYKTIAKQISIPGFRKGKVPSRVIDQRVGRAAVLEEAVNEILPMAYEDALRENSVSPLGRPEIEVTELNDGESLTFVAEVDVRPEFDLPDYAGIVVEVDDAEVTDENVDEQLLALRGRFASLSPVERAAADGDVLLVDIMGAEADGSAVEDLSGQALSYELGTDGMLPGFDDAVRGASAGETRTFDFTPEGGEYVDRLLTVNATVAAVRERVLPEANDDFAQLASEFDTVDELREDIRTRLGRVRVLEQGMQARGKVHEALLASVDFPLPEGVIRQEVDEHFADGHAGDDAHRAEVEQGASDGLRSRLLLDRIAEAEEVSVGESELSSWLLQNAPRYGMAPDAFAQALVQAGQLPMAIGDIRRAKALAVVTQKARVVDASGRTVDLESLDEELRAAEGDDALS